MMTNFDYSEFEDRILKNSFVLSRSRKGEFSISSGSEKILLTQNSHLKDIVLVNEKNACQFVWSLKDKVNTSPSGIYAGILNLANIINNGIVPEGKIYREWIPPEGNRIPPSAIDAELRRLCAYVSSKWGLETGKAILLASILEFRLNIGDIHPFYDGCGRISRLSSALILICHGSMPPVWQDYSSYYAFENRSLLSFCKYMKERVLINQQNISS